MADKNIAPIAEELTDTDERAPFLHENKQTRLLLDGLIKTIRESKRKSRERSLLITKLEEAVMWAGMDIKALHDGATCYPESYNPDSKKIHAEMK